MIHALKAEPKNLQEVLDGSKTFELRKEDDGRFIEGDILRLREWTAWGWDGPGIPGRYTGREVSVVVTYILRDERWLQPGVAILGIRVEEGAYGA